MCKYFNFFLNTIRIKHILQVCLLLLLILDAVSSIRTQRSALWQVCQVLHHCFKLTESSIPRFKRSILKTFQSRRLTSRRTAESFWRDLNISVTFTLTTCTLTPSTHNNYFKATWVFHPENNNINDSVIPWVSVST